MADFKTAPTIGARIAAVRKARGFKSAKDLADAVPNDTVTESILQNIEAGRKSDLTISQLLNIAWALQVAPGFLLMPIGLPDAHPDLPNLSEGVAALSIGEFDGWLSGLTTAAYGPRHIDERNERFQLESLRELLEQRRELHRLEVMLQMETESFGAGADEDFYLESTANRIANTRSRVADLEDYLATSGWPTSKPA